MTSKTARRRKRKTRASPVCCPACHGPGDATPQALLAALASILNTTTSTGARLRVRRDHVIAEWAQAGGYVLEDSRGRWHVALLTYDPDTPPARPGDLDDD